MKVVACCFGVSACRICYGVTARKNKEITYGIIPNVIHMHIPHPAVSSFFQHQFQFREIAGKEISFVFHIFDLMLCFACIAQIMLVKKSEVKQLTGNPSGMDMQAMC